MTPASENTTIPPTLLRLPDLDPEASSMLQTVQPKEHEEVASKPEPASEIDRSPESDVSEGLPTPTEAVVKFPTASRVTPLEPASSPPEPVSRKKPRIDPETTDTEATEDESDSWLTTFASRKSLLVMLALIAALAIFFPRGDNVTSEKGTSLLVDESSPEPTMVPFQLERYPATKLAPPIASSPPPAGSAGRLSDPTKVIPPSTTSTASVPVRQPVETPAGQEIASLAPPRTGMIPQPPKTPWDEQSEPESSVAPFASMDEVLSFAQKDQGNRPLASAAEPIKQYPQTASPQSPLIEPGSVAALLEGKTPVQPMVNNAVAKPSSPKVDAEVPARLVNSRTPQGIYNWKKFLPPFNGDSASATAPSSTVAQASSQSPSVPEIRTSNAPVAPSFEFALPAGTSPAASDGAGSSNPVQTDRNGAPAFAPEARVAMPSQSSLR